jgi:hypothetical protein
MLHEIELSLTALKLLVLFDTVMEKRHVTRAVERLTLSPLPFVTISPVFLPDVPEQFASQTLVIAAWRPQRCAATRVQPALGKSLDPRSPVPQGTASFSASCDAFACRSG